MTESQNKQAVDHSRLRNSHVVVTVIIGLIGVIATICSIGLGLKGQYGEVGPGFFPMSLGLVLIILAAIILFSNFKDSYDESNSIFFGWERVGIFFGLLLATVTLIEIIGFFGAVFLFTVGYETFIQTNKKPWWVRIVTGLVISGGIQLLFTKLMVQLPGPFWQ